MIPSSAPIPDPPRTTEGTLNSTILKIGLLAGGIVVALTIGEVTLRLFAAITTPTAPTGSRNPRGA